MGVLSMEIEKVNNTLLTEKQQRQREKEQRKEYEQLLFNEFYNHFRKRQHNFEANYRYYNNINKREEVLHNICSNSSDFIYLNTLYSKKLKEVYKIFKDNFEFVQEQEKQEELEHKEQMQILANELKLVLQQKQQEESILSKPKKQKKYVFNILAWTLAVIAFIWILIKYLAVVGIALVIIIFLVILGCSKK